MKKKSNFFKKYHKWIGIIISLFILLFSVSGIVLNHRKTFSSIDVNRNFLPQEFRYNNWNLSAVKSSLKLSEDSILLYGNIGIYLTNHDLSSFQDFNKGFAQGIDNRKIEKIYKTKSGIILASTIFNIYRLENNEWVKIELPIKKQRIVDITENDKEIVLLSRSEILRTSDLIDFSVEELPNPVEYDNKIGLFKTIWVIHSGEIYGEYGKLIVDFIALVFAILSITGIIYFVFPSLIKRRKKKKLSTKKHVTAIKSSLKWHNRLGLTLGVFLFFTTLTGMFLRPPLLIPIAYEKVDKIPYTELDTPNAWFDKLRKIIYNEDYDTYFIATNEGLYYSNDNFNSELKQIPINIPISVMGINVFEFNNNGNLLVGTFNGLFELNFQHGNFIDYTTKRPYAQNSSRRGSPIGKVMAAGYSNDFSVGEIYFDYNKGLKSISDNNLKIEMPKEISESRISLWNTALEVHTARIYEFILGDFYILFIPLFGLSVLFVLVSGFIVWFRGKYKW